MKTEEHHWHSEALGHEMWLKVYGHDGRPVVAFPSQDGRYGDWEGWGMVDAVGGLIAAGRLRLIALDSVDWQSWTNHAAAPADRARRHDAYDRYVAGEVAPFVASLTGVERAWTTGASMGAYHALNVLLRHPDRFDGTIAMSGLYRLRHFIGDYVDDAVYFHSPLHFLPGLDDDWYLSRLRQASIAIVVGQGAWEDEMLEDTRELEALLRAKGIPAIVDYWGEDVNHDWPWWRVMLPHYLERLGV
ncbi:MAG TPA: alpha/beta fold hydrolase [Candidatus Limnocylindrales bacterium]